MLKLHTLYLDGSPLDREDYSRITDAASPRFSWCADSSRPDNRQIARRITVLHGDRLLWDSGWVESDAQEALYAGSALPYGRPLTLTVTLRDRFGEESAPASAMFVYGVLPDWNGRWIAPAEDRDGTVIHFRRRFTIREGLESACLALCGLGYHRASLNDGKALTYPLDPAHSNYAHLDYYTVHPLKPEELRVGENTLDVLVADGWRRNSTNLLDTLFAGRTIEFFGRPMLNAVLELVYADGRTERVVTDTSWEAAHTGISAKIFGGEAFDARLRGLEQFSPAVVIPDGPGRDAVLRPMTLQPIDFHQTYDAVDMWQLDEDRYIFDFGQNLAGVCTLRLPRDLEAGQTITIRHAELLDENGELYTAPLRDAKATDTYIAAGNGLDAPEWTPAFTYHGFRYAELKGIGASDLSLLRARALYTSIDKPSRFTCGSALINQLHRNCVQTERANLHSIMTDCPQRDERMGWLNDATVRFEATPYSFDVSRIFPKIVRDIRAEQDENGAFACCAPMVFGARPADPVCSSYLIAGLEAYMHTGNTAILAESFDGWAAWENCLLANSTDYIVNYSYYGDWAGPAYACVGEDGAVSAVTPGILMSTGYSYFNARTLARIAEILGRSADAAFFADAAAKIKSAYLRKWWHPDTAKVADGSQGAQVFTLWLGLLDDESEQKRAAAVLHDDLAAHDYRFTTGNLCTRYLMDILARYGYIDDAWRILTSERYPSFGFMIQNEATTVWERFELKKNPGMNSHNHPMYAAVDYWFYAFLCGMTPAAPGWKKASIEPHFPTELLSAQASVDTVQGRFGCKWTRRYGKLMLDVNVPFGAEAEVRFCGSVHTVTSGSHHFAIDDPIGEIHGC